MKSILLALSAVLLAGAFFIAEAASDMADVPAKRGAAPSSSTSGPG